MKGLIFTYSLTYGGAFAALFDPFVGVIVYVSLSILRPESLWPWAVPEGNYSRLIMIATTLGWLKEQFGCWQFGRARGIIVALMVFFCWGTLSASQALNQEVAWKWVADIFKIVLPVFIGITTVKSLNQLKSLAWVIVLSYGYLALEFNLYYLHGILYVTSEHPFGGIEEGSLSIGMVAAVGVAIFLGLHYERWWIP